MTAYPYRLKTLCPHCCCQDGLIRILGGQNVLRCKGCGAYIKCVPKADFNPDNYRGTPDRTQTTQSNLF